MGWVQINLKVDEAVAREWRRRAAEAGHPSIRKWLESITIEPEPGLADRVAAHEARLTALEAAVRGGPVAELKPEPLPAMPEPQPVAEAITTKQLAARLNLSPEALAAQIRRAHGKGGIRPGLEHAGWRCVGHRPSSAGGPQRAVWEPVGSSRGSEAV